MSHLPRHAPLAVKQRKRLYAALIVTVLVADTQVLAAFPLGFQNPGDILLVDAKRLFAKHMTSGRKGIDDHGGVQVMRGADVDHIGFFARKHFAVIGVERGTLLIAFGEARELCLVNIADRNQLPARLWYSQAVQDADAAKADNG